MTSVTHVDVTTQHLTSVNVITRASVGLPDEVVVTTDHARIALPDPIGVWEQLTDQLRDEHGQHMAEWLTAPNGPADVTTRACSVYRADSGRHCGKPAGTSGRCNTHERNGA